MTIERAIEDSEGRGLVRSTSIDKFPTFFPQEVAMPPVIFL
jgi:hypothetical protein